jgi:hypothetical protein
MIASKQTVETSLDPHIEKTVTSSSIDGLQFFKAGMDARLSASKHGCFVGG